MKPAEKHIFTLLALLVIAFALVGCGGVAVSGYGYTPVYGDYGYVGPWDRGPVVVAGGYFTAPPYGQPGGPRRDEDHRPAQAAPERNRAPAQHAAPRPIPSIPNHPRPSGSHDRGNSNKDRR